MKKKLFLLLFLFLNTLVYPIEIKYNNSDLQWLGRWNEITDVGKWSGWEGSQLVFKIRGTKTIEIKASVIDQESTVSCAITVSIDRFSKVNFYHFTEESEIFEGKKSVLINLPDTTLREIIIHTAVINQSLFFEKSKTIINSIIIDSSAKIVNELNSNKKILLAIGDSWMGSESNYFQFMNREKWQLFPVASGGLAVYNMDAQFDYSYFNHLASDPPSDAVIIGFGVNDINRNLSNLDFEFYMKSLINKVTLQHKNAPIYLVQTPKNNNLQIDYGYFGTVMNKLANKFRNVYYISTRPIESKISWADDFHLDIVGRKTMAVYLDSCINNLEINGEPIPPVYYTKDSVNQCNNNIYNFNGHNYFNSGQYKDTIESIDGCDSIIETNLLLYPKYNKAQTISLCEGEKYIFNEHNYFEKGIYVDTLKTINGCDSIIETNIVLNPTFIHKRNETICNSEIYSFNGHIYSQEGAYIDTLKTINGCDSIIITQLKISDCKVKVYPNPIMNEFNVEFNVEEKGDVIIELFDITGISKFKVVLNNQEKGIHYYKFDDIKGDYHKRINLLKVGVNNIFIIKKVIVL